MSGRRLGVLAAAALAAACAGAPSAPARPGEATARRKCGACHRVPAPDHARGDAWKVALRAHAGRVALTAQDTAEIEQYLLAAD